MPSFALDLRRWAARARQAKQNTIMLDVIKADLISRQLDAQAETIDRLQRELEAARAAKPSYQARVVDWMQACFPASVLSDRTERSFRFLEEALELGQAQGVSKAEALDLVDYVYGRDVGEPEQEVGGVLVCLAALCHAAGLDMDQAGETELARVWTLIDKIRAKHAAKPVGIRMALPGDLAPQEPSRDR